ncbi:TIGR03089 family protein [Psychromicrobium sp. YIM B11713]|uniref:TIGR03089 family protein n=1 Tax=Psychromicrobium sp. YIM B11713 TaxID=3145233 RepID=UPI00374F3694
MNPLDIMLNRFRTESPGSPRLTWYGTDGARIELSGKVLDNWVAKTSNFLTEEFDFGPDSVLRVALPAHWKSLCLVLGALGCGGTVSDQQPGDLLASSEPEQIGSATGPTIAVALGALALQWEGELPAQAQDYAAEVRMFADAFERFSDPDQHQLALEFADYSEQYARLPQLTEELLGKITAEPARICLNAEHGLAKVVRQALASWQSGGSVVLAEQAELITERMLSMEGAVQL